MGGSAEDVVRRFYREIWTERRYDVAVELVHPDLSYPAAPRLRGPEGSWLPFVRITRPSRTSPSLLTTWWSTRPAWRPASLAGTDLGRLRGMPASGKAVKSWASTSSVSRVASSATGLPSTGWACWFSSRRFPTHGHDRLANRVTSATDDD